MAQRKSIPLNLEPEVIAQSGKMTYQEIVDWLRTEKGVKTSRGSVERLMRGVKQERKEIARQAYAKAIAEAAPRDMEIISENVALLMKMRDDAIAGKRPVEARQNITVLNQTVQMRLALSGLDKDDSPNEASRTEETLLEQIDLFEAERKKEQLN